MLYVEEMNALHHQSSRKQSLALRELLAGPKVGDNDNCNENDYDGDAVGDKGGGDEVGRAIERRDDDGKMGHTAGGRDDGEKDSGKARERERTASEDVRGGREDSDVADSGAVIATSPPAPAALSFAHITQACTA